MQFERKQAHGRVVDRVWLPAAIAGEASETLQTSGFQPSMEMSVDGEDEPDGCTWPPLRALACGGGSDELNQHFGPGWIPIRVHSIDGELGSEAGFVCTQDFRRKIFYAKMETGEGNDGEDHAFKSAMSCLLDVAEANCARKITLGLLAEHTTSSNLVCYLLYLGFQVTISRKCPLRGCVLLLDFELGIPNINAQSSASANQTCTATSDCSTSAEEDDDDEEEGKEEKEQSSNDSQDQDTE
mmetsp:Transcript_23673/g.51777  ORF Transcript_23673/g.51777 Transcript_23673/m.51777 type:complete len:241 (-) Transcript_23673:350-1072(-)